MRKTMGEKVKEILKRLKEKTQGGYCCIHHEFDIYSGNNEAKETWLLYIGRAHVTVRFDTFEQLSKHVNEAYFGG